MNKLGQITVFIILGLVLVMFAGVGIYLNEQTGGFEESIIIPAEVRPIESLIETCIYDTAKDSILSMGANGGYYQLPAEIRYEKNAFIPVDPSGLTKIPHWYYQGESRIPSEEYIELEIARAIDEEFIECIGNLTSFEEDFEIVKEEQIVDVQLADDEVVVNVEYPVDVVDRNNRDKTELKYFKVKLPVRLKQLRDLGEAIVIQEVNSLFLENWTMDLLAAMPEDDIPTTSLDFKCGNKRWRIDEIEDLFDRVIQQNIVEMRLENTDYLPFEADEDLYKKWSDYSLKLRSALAETETDEFGVDRYEDVFTRQERYKPSERPSDLYHYFHSYINLDHNVDKDLKASFVYQPEWNSMDLTAYPSDGIYMDTNMMKGASKYMRFLCINTYHFAYDIIFPVEVRLRDPDAFNGQGFTMSLGIPVTIEKNMGTKEPFETSSFDTVTFDQEFCSTLGDQKVDIRVSGIDEYGYVVPEIDDVNISIRCVNKLCDYIGKTTANDGHYRLVTYIPECKNPWVIANKEGYMEGKAQLIGDTVTVPLRRLQQMEFEVRKVPYNAYPEPGSYSDIEELSEEWNESATIMFSMNNGKMTQFLNYPYKGNFTTVDLDAEKGNYSVDIVLTSYGDLIGGYQNDELVITYDQIANKNKMIFYAFEYRPLSGNEGEDNYNIMWHMINNETTEKLVPTFE